MIGEGDQLVRPFEPYGVSDFSVNYQSQRPEKYASTNERALKVGLAVFALLALGVATWRAAVAIENQVPSVGEFSTETVAMGLSLGALYFAANPPEWRKLSDRAISSLSYMGYLYPMTQIYRNLDGMVSEGQLKAAEKIMHGMGFLVPAGFLAMRDFCGRFARTRSEFSNELECPKNEEELYPMLPPATRNATAFRFWAVAHGINMIALTTAFCLYRNAYLGPTSKIGLPANLAAIYSGYVLGEDIAHMADDVKEHFEQMHKRSDEGLSLGLKCARMLKNQFILNAPIFMGIGLQFLSSPNPSWEDTKVNSVRDYTLLATTAALFGAMMFLLKRERENPMSAYNISRRKVEPIQFPELGNLSCRKVYKILKPFCFSAIAMAGLLGWTIAIGVLSDEPKIQEVASTQFVSVVVASLITLLVVKGHNPSASEEAIPSEASLCEALSLELKTVPLRAKNLIHFLCTNPEFKAFFYTYMRMRFENSDDRIHHDPNLVFYGDLATGIAWGGAVGNSLALYATGNEPDVYTPPLVRMELARAVISGFTK